jgi:hypothetical protein
MSETNLTKAIGRRVKKRGGWIRKIHQGIHGAGFPDCVVGYRGVAMFWEIKVPGNTTTELQKQTHKEMKEKGGLLVFVVESTEQADKLLDIIDRRRDGHRPRKKGT